jgi:hypothetical protein
MPSKAKINIFMIRPICPKCNKQVCAINYLKNGKYHYRSICNECGKKKPRKKPRTFLWQKSGYKKKTICDLCGFRSIYATQIVVYHIDGDLTNIALNNLRSICLCCVEVVKRKEVTWKRGDLLVDY